MTDYVNATAEIFGEEDDDATKKRKRVEDLMRVLFSNFLLPFKELNIKLELDDQDKKVVEDIRKEYPELLVGGSNDYISLPLIFATITKILTGREMRFLSDEKRNVSGVKFFK